MREGVSERVGRGVRLADGALSRAGRPKAIGGGRRGGASDKEEATRQGLELAAGVEKPDRDSLGRLDKPGVYDEARDMGF